MRQGARWMRWITGALLPLVLLSGCAVVGAPRATTSPRAATPTVSAIHASGDAYPYADVRFRPAVDYLTALRLVTNLGLQPLSSCLGAGGSTTPWRSADQSAAFADTNTPGSLQVMTTPLTPADWVSRLSATTGVVSVYDGPIYCPMIPVDLVPVSGRLYFLGRDAPTVYVRVGFATASVSGYAHALDAVSDLGFRLADPCFERSSPAPAWRPMSQQADFASSGVLVVATTAANSLQWSAQLKHTPGVIAISAPYAPSC